MCSFIFFSVAFNVIANYMRADISNNEILATFVCACVSKRDLSVMHV